MLACEVWNVAVNQLDDEELSIGYFQQDGATININKHTRKTKMEKTSQTA
jgi:hypothetical protein